MPKLAVLDVNLRQIDSDFLNQAVLAPPLEDVARRAEVIAHAAVNVEIFRKLHLWVGDNTAVKLYIKNGFEKDSDYKNHIITMVKPLNNETKVTK